MRRPRADKGASMIHCVLCERIGVIKAFRNMLNLEEHMQEHARGQVMFGCSTCGNVPVSVDGVLHECPPPDRERRRVRLALEEDHNNAIENASEEEMCPKCRL